jgi:fused signal recognition particle receptor
LGLFDKLKHGLSKTRKSLIENTTALLSGKTVDENLLEELEEVLIMADIGPQASSSIISGLRERVDRGKIRNDTELRDALKEDSGGSRHLQSRCY